MHEEPKKYNTILVLSSCVFLTNAVVSFYSSYVVYAVLFLALFATSAVVHSHYNQFTSIIDMVSIYAVILYGGWMFFKKLGRGLSHLLEILLVLAIISTFSIVIWLYVWGKFKNQLYFDPNPGVRTVYHAILHVISSIGHHCIVFL